MTERWHTEQISPDKCFIQNGNLVVGSIVAREGLWFVEILWSGPGLDIKGSFPDYPTALAFVQGVEGVVMRVGVPTTGRVIVEDR